MKSILIIGMGEFGHHLTNNFVRLGNEVMIVDKDEEKVMDIANAVTSTKIADCTNIEVLKSLGVNNFDIIFICIGSNFQSSLEITNLVKELGGRLVISKATRDIQKKFLLRNGADEVIYPDKDIAQKCAAKYTVNNIFDYVELTKGFAIYEIKPLKTWIDKSIRELNIAALYHISILGTRKGEKRNIMPPADHIIQADEHLIVLASDEAIANILH